MPAWSHRSTRIAAALALLALVAVVVVLARRSVADPNALWRIVHEDCVPAQEHTHQPGQCRRVDLAGRYVVLKDRRGRTQFLLLPTDRISGIESATLLSASSPNYWQAAWQAGEYVRQQIGQQLPRDLIGLAINSVRARSQNQLHIHIDCVQPQLHEALAAAEAQTSPHWSAQPLWLAAHSYYVLKLPGADLNADPFQLLAQMPRHCPLRQYPHPIHLALSQWYSMPINHQHR